MKNRSFVDSVVYIARVNVNIQEELNRILLLKEEISAESIRQRLWLTLLACRLGAGRLSSVILMPVVGVRDGGLKLNPVALL